MNEWTTERFDLLKELAKVGSNSWIAREINTRTGATFSRNAIIGKKTRNGLESSAPCGSSAGNQIPRKRRGNGDGGLQRRLVNRRNMKSKPLPEEAFMQDFIGLPLVELEANDCRYPQGEGPYLFCGQPAIEGSSYCAYHHRLCHNGIPERPVKRNQGKLSVAWGGV